MFAQQEVIRSSADLRNHYNEISRQCREDNEAVIITVNEEETQFPFPMRSIRG